MIFLGNSSAIEMCFFSPLEISCNGVYRINTDPYYYEMPLAWTALLGPQSCG